MTVEYIVDLTRPKSFGNLRDARRYAVRWMTEHPSARYVDIQHIVRDNRTGRIKVFDGSGQFERVIRKNGQIILLPHLY